MEEKTVIFNWSLSNINLDANYITARDIKSPIFPDQLIDNERNQHSWVLKLTKPNKGFDLSLCLTWAKSKFYFCTEFELKLKFKAYRSWSSISSGKHLFHTKFNPVRTVKNFISSTTLTDLNKDKTFGPLEISCIMKIQKENCSIHTNPNEIPEFEKMFNNKQYSDFTVFTLGGEFFVHKNILATRSEVFAVMFENEMKEKKEGFVKIIDFEEKVVVELLRYIYCGKVQDLENLSRDLLNAADKYSVGGLKIICLEEMCTKISTENALELLSLIDYHKVDHLKAFVINFIVINVQKIDECHFKSLNNFDLMHDIFSKAKIFIQ